MPVPFVTAAASLGHAAFEAGLTAVPALDPAFCALLEANPDKSIGASLPLLDAWTRAWHQANIAAPVPLTEHEAWLKETWEGSVLEGS